MTSEKTQSQHPYAKKLEENLVIQRNMLILLESKVECLTILIKEGEEFKSEERTAAEKLALIEKKQQKMKAEGEISVLKKIIHEKEQYYKGYMEQFVKDEEEVNKKFKHTVDIAKKSTKPNVQKLLSQIAWDRIEEDIEAKIAVYKQLRKHV